MTKHNGHNLHFKGARSQKNPRNHVSIKHLQGKGKQGTKNSSGDRILNDSVTDSRRNNDNEKITVVVEDNKNNGVHPEESTWKKFWKWIGKYWGLYLPIIGLIFTIANTVLNYKKNREGNLKVWIYNKEVTSSTSRTALVYLDKDSADISRHEFFPLITNPSRFHLKDVYIKYTISSDSSNISYIDNYYIVRSYQGKKILEREHTVFNNDTVLSPFSSFYVKPGGHANVRLDIRVNRKKEILTYTTDIFSKKIFSENRYERYRDIFYDAYNPRETRENIYDIYVIEEGKKPNSIRNLSQDSIRRLYEKYASRCFPQMLLDESVENLVESEKDGKLNPYEDNTYLQTSQALLIVRIILWIIFIVLSVLVAGVLFSNKYNIGNKVIRTFTSLLYLSIFNPFVFNAHPEWFVNYRIMIHVMFLILLIGLLSVLRSIIKILYGIYYDATTFLKLTIIQYILMGIVMGAWVCIYIYVMRLT